MTNKKHLLTSILVAVLGFFVQAQSDTASIALKTMAGGASHNYVRWAPMDYPTWKAGNSKGYLLKRYITAIGETVSTLSEYQASEVVFGPFMANSATLLALSDSNEMAGVALACLFGDSLSVLPPGGATLGNIYAKSKETQTRFGWSLFAADQDLDVAMAMGLAYMDKDVVEHYVYQYVVSVNDPSLVQKNGVDKVTTGAPPPAQAAPANLAFLPKDKGVVVSWTPNPALYSSYDIERSDDGGSTFQRINEHPVAYLSNTAVSSYLEPSVSYTDSLADNTTVYVYRVQGRNAFGFTGPFSDTIWVTGKPDRLPVLWHIDEVIETEQDVTIKWVFPAQYEPMMSGFEVLRGSKAEGPFTPLSASAVSMTERTFRDLQPQASNYYVVRTVDVNGYAYQTFSRLGQLKDKTPPEPPVAVSGSCNRSGMVRLHWSPSTSPDAMGYRVFFSNVKDGDFLQITSHWVKDTFFSHQINVETLTEEVYFAVKALDYRQNLSRLSRPALVRRPDVVPPSAPHIERYEANDQSITFVFAPSSSTDVVQYRFERRQEGIPGWAPLFTVPATQLPGSYEDVSGHKQYWYFYRLVAVDDAGLISASTPLRVKRVDDGLRQGIQNLSGVQPSGEKTIRLSWNYPVHPQLIGFEVYRAIQDSTRRRSYAFVLYPDQGTAITPAYKYAHQLSGAQIQTHFTDYDVDLRNIPQMNQYHFFGTDAMNPNQALTPISNTTVAGQYAVPNPNNLAGQSIPSQPGFYYWVVARYADGAASPIAGPVWVLLN